MTRPTRRGLAVLGVAVAAFVMAGLFGARALNAVVVPAGIALAFGAVQLRRVDTLRIERQVPEPGFPGDRRTVSIGIDAERFALATVEERVPEALSPDRTVFETTTGTTVSYGIEPASRGVYTVGPLSVTLTDTLGLFARTVRSSRRDSVVVYPRVDVLPATDPFDPSNLIGASRIRDRQLFDRLREYERGDSLRDVHWKTSAKRADGEFVVKQFAAEEEAGGITIVAESDRSEADALARATASLATRLLDSGVSVALVLGDEVVERGSGPEQRHALLSALARTEGGRVDAEADVRIEIDGGEIVVTTADGRRTFGRPEGVSA